ncbi:GNAT family N-acetyltransferase [Moritella sp.]|uniref:GNAT family N-acetyltransferase n=1 Tax=Moritella sp. TaxID=78556 RepID=UPI001DB80872|nr:GNAT family N-acetyltransferase [Moritella sp.]MCJ8348160.1 GNAT family N-acetyltransferase [Moritella sp.]NQZ40545.1 GNAT family N-acetyltransferase [Moritella sp.]
MDEAYKISANFEDMDLAVIHEFISGTYWAKGIPMSTLKRSLENSLCFGVFTQAGEQVGFARMITDKATFAYLADVFVLEPHQGKGLSKLLMAAILDHPDLQGLRRMMLATRDAHGLYQKFGFTALAAPEVYMELHTPYLYE